MTALFSTPQPQAAPAPKPPAPMPDTESPSVIEARRRAEQNVLNRAGRRSTILTAPKDRGGSDYSSTTLGSNA